MRPSKAHIVTSCQQVLALGVVLAALAPAASVVSLDVVHRGPEAAPSRVPHAAGQPARSGLPGAEDPGQQGPPQSTVPVDTVEPKVTEVALTAESGGDPADPGSDSRPDGDDRTPVAPGPVGRTTEELSRTTVLSQPQPVTGYGAVGVTWSHDDQVQDDQIELQVRTTTDGEWSAWTDLEYHDEHAPDPGTDEGRDTRPGTDPLFVGEVDRVQLRAVAASGLPDDMSLAVVAPGRAATVAEQAPELAPEQRTGPATGSATAPDALELQSASASAPRPKIYSREQWGADERLRDGQPSYGTVSAGFVHHTVNANAYSRDQVPGIVRSIYAYHTQSRGWSDVGYNFLVDKFGRIWEGRYGGVARAVVGAHTLGYNEDSFAMSAIGNFDTVRPPDAMLRAYGSLFAWKLGLAGVDPRDRSQNVNGTTFAAINGHRDAGSTACPGRYLYEKLPAIRSYAAEAGDPEEPEEPDPVTLEQVDSDLAATSYPDLVVRRASDGRGVILPTGGLTSFRTPSTVARSGWAARTFLAIPDLTGDDQSDLVTFDDQGGLQIRPGPAADGYREVTRTSRKFRGHDLVASAGDLDADGRADFVARAEGKLVTLLRTRRGGFRQVPQETGLRRYEQLVGAGDVTGDVRPDLWARDGSGGLWLHRGLGDGRFADRTQVSVEDDEFDAMVGGIDYTGDAVPDLVVRGTDGALVVLPARGDGTLGRAIGPVGDAAGLSMIGGAGDIAGKASPDLVATGSDGALVVLRNRGTFDLGQPINTGQSFARADLLLNAGDFDGDGHGDVIMRRGIGSLWLYRGRGTGKLADPQRIGGRRAFGKVTGLRVVADVTGDDRHDVVGRVEKQTMVWRGKGAGALTEKRAIEVADAASGGVNRADYDWIISTSDLRGRGRADLVVRDRDGYLSRLDGGPSGYAAPRNLGEAGDYDLGG